MDAFIVIFKTIKTHSGSSLESWMKSIVVHKAIDYFRKHKNDPAFDEIEYVLDKKVELQAAENLEVEELAQMLYSLPAGYRMVLTSIPLKVISTKKLLIS